MDIKRFKENIIPTIFGSEGDGTFSTLRILTEGMSGIRTAKLINFASLCMDPKDFYLEVGTFTGFTLISAAYQTNSVCIGVDDFSVKDILSSVDESAKSFIRKRLAENIKNYGNGNINFAESNFRNIVLEDEVKGRLAVLFIDGNHDYENVKETIEKFKPHFSDQCVLVFDDVQMGGIEKYVHELCLSGEFEMMIHLVSTLNDHDRDVHKGKYLNPLISNGISVLVRNKKEGDANA